MYLISCHAYAGLLQLQTHRCGSCKKHALMSLMCACFQKGLVSTMPGLWFWKRLRGRHHEHDRTQGRADSLQGCIKLYLQGQRDVRKCMCIFILRVYVHVTYVNVHVYSYRCMYMHVYMYLGCMCTCTSTYIHRCIYTQLYVCVFVCSRQMTSR